MRGLAMVLGTAGAALFWACGDSYGTAPSPKDAGTSTATDGSSADVVPTAGLCKTSKSGLPKKGYRVISPKEEANARLTADELVVYFARKIDDRLASLRSERARRIDAFGAPTEVTEVGTGFYPFISPDELDLFFVRM